ncbi:MAG: flagellar hook-associated protein FlgK [Sulfuritalea sp.]|jgi:flagellar hook-associated protein 1 FlgK|nr:flagellar hook-associated protein FlgK [Sulfuritalea sp.]MBK9348823.1 flagellar hook-associated protein FlgK [Sulfuritalea sp.]
MGILSIGVTGLNAAQTGLLTTSHNIANASTPGYSRQYTVQGTNVALYSGAGYVGQGGHVETVRRSYDQLLARNVLSAEAGASEMDSYLSQIHQIDNMFADVDSGLSPSLANFFRGVQDVAANPTSLAARQSMLSASEALTARFKALDERLADVSSGVNSQVTTQITQINTFSSQLADINQRVVLARASGISHEPNDLLDQREQILKDLNKLVRITTATQSDGSFNVFVGAGQPLVVGNQAFQLKAVRAPDNAEQITVGLIGPGGTAQVIPESQITGGSLGGVLRFRSETLNTTQNALGRIALTLGQNINDQNRLGQDLTGAPGQTIFNLSVPRVTASSSNTGSGAPDVAIDTESIAELTTSNYDLAYVGGSYRLTRHSDNLVRTYGSLPQTVDGFTISAGAWAPAANDSILIQPTRDGAHNLSVAMTDIRAIAAAAPVRVASALANTGQGAIEPVVVNGPPPVNANLQHKVTISFTSATSFDVVDVTAGSTLASGVSYTAGADISYNGWTTTIRGVPVTGDVFSVETNTNGVADNRNAALLGALQTRSTMNASSGGSPTATYQSAYAQIVSLVGSKSNEVEAIGAAQQSLADQATTSLQSVAGVNLDEEAANLLRYQQAYQAAAKVIEIASKIFDEVLALAR